MTNEEIGTRLDSQSDAIGDISVRLTRLDEALRGNGNHGLFTDFALVKKRVKILEEFCHDVRSMRRWLVGGILAAVGSVVCSAIMWVLKMQ